jgi:citrate synthase
MIMINER